MASAASLCASLKHNPAPVWQMVPFLGLLSISMALQTWGSSRQPACMVTRCLCLGGNALAASIAPAEGKFVHSTAQQQIRSCCKACCCVLTRMQPCSGVSNTFFASVSFCSLGPVLLCAAHVMNMIATTRYEEFPQAEQAQQQLVHAMCVVVPPVAGAAAVQQQQLQGSIMSSTSNGHPQAALLWTSTGNGSVYIYRTADSSLMRKVRYYTGKTAERLLRSHSCHWQLCPLNASLAAAAGAAAYCADGNDTAMHDSSSSTSGAWCSSNSCTVNNPMMLCCGQQTTMPLQYCSRQLWHTLERSLQWLQPCLAAMSSLGAQISRWGSVLCGRKREGKRAERECLCVPRARERLAMCVREALSEQQLP